jgi:hypothetical protein
MPPPDRLQQFHSNPPAVSKSLTNTIDVPRGRRSFQLFWIGFDSRLSQNFHNSSRYVLLRCRHPVLFTGLQIPISVEPRRWGSLPDTGALEILGLPSVDDSVLTA